MVLAVEYLSLLPVWPVAPVEEHVVRPGGLGLDGLEAGHEGGGVLPEAGQRGHGEGGAKVVVVLGRERARHPEHEAAVAAAVGIWSEKKVTGKLNFDILCGWQKKVAISSQGEFLSNHCRWVFPS